MLNIKISSNRTLKSHFKREGRSSIKDTNYKLNTKSRELKWSKEEERKRYDRYGS